MNLNIENEADLRIYLNVKWGFSQSDIDSIQSLRGGVSNKTVLVIFKNGERWILKQALEKLRVKDDWFCSPDRIKKEGLGMKTLNKFLPEGKVPKLIFEDYTNYLIAMEAVPMPHENLKDLLLAGSVNFEYLEQLGKLLADLHNNGIEKQNEILPLFDNLSFFKTLRLEPYYDFTASKFSELKSFYDHLIQDCLQNRYTLTHGDFSPKNILIFRKNVILLDHEVIHFGDGTFDLGFFMTHLFSKAIHLKKHRSRFISGAKKYWTSYLKNIRNWDDKKEARAVRHTLGCLMARVHGRSPLEYLSLEEKDLQMKVCMQLIKPMPSSVLDLIIKFDQILDNE